MFDTNNPSRFNPWMAVAVVLSIALVWTLSNLYIFSTKTSRLGSSQSQKMWYAVEHSETKLRVDQKDADRLWQLTHNLSIPCWRLDFDNNRENCLITARNIANTVLETKHHTYQFQVCTPGVFGEDCTRLRPYTTEHIKIFDSLVAIQNQYWAN